MPTRRMAMTLLAAQAVLGACASPPAARPAAHAGAGPVPPRRVAWRDTDPRFGGLSALHVAADGGTALALGDRGLGWRADLVRDVAGHLTGLVPKGPVALAAPEGSGSEPRDMEAMAIGPDGSIHIALEGKPARVERHSPGSNGPAQQVPSHPDFATFPVNTGPEALSIDPQGRLVLIPEQPRDGGFPIYRLEGDRWRIISRIAQRDGFVPVGAAHGPDGALYLLERWFRRPFFASRVSRVDLSSGGPVAPAATIIQTAPGEMDNLEGISVGAGQGNRLRISCVSDNNFNWLLRSELVEWTLN